MSIGQSCQWTNLRCCRTVIYWQLVKTANTWASMLCLNSCLLGKGADLRTLLLARLKTINFSIWFQEKNIYSDAFLKPDNFFKSVERTKIKSFCKSLRITFFSRKITNCFAAMVVSCFHSTFLECVQTGSQQGVKICDGCGSPADGRASFDWSNTPMQKNTGADLLTKKSYKLVIYGK